MYTFPHLLFDVMKNQHAHKKSTKNCIYSEFSCSCVLWKLTFEVTLIFVCHNEIHITAATATETEKKIRGKTPLLCNNFTIFSMIFFLFYLFAKNIYVYTIALYFLHNAVIFALKKNIYVPRKNAQK